MAIIIYLIAGLFAVYLMDKEVTRRGEVERRLNDKLSRMIEETKKNK